MKIYACRVTLNKFGSNVPKVNCTAAELHLLAHIHEHAARRYPIFDIKETGSDNRTSAEEKARLQRIYKASHIEALYPGKTPTFPDAYVAPVVETPARDLERESTETED